MSAAHDASEVAPRLDPLFDAAIRDGAFSGASLLVALSGEIFLERYWGKTQAGGSPIDANSCFDLASLTKPLATTWLCMRAVAQGRISLDAPLREFLATQELPADKADIRLRHLLNHCAGFPAYRPFYERLIGIPSADRRRTLLTWILNTPLDSPPEAAARYSDLGFLLLGMILERVCEAPLDALFAAGPGGGELSFQRLRVGLDPAEHSEREGQAPGIFVATEACPWRKRLLKGEVHDENAYCLGGVAGHAGLFGGARGVFAIIRPLWAAFQGEPAGEIPSEIVRTFFERQSMVPGSSWALGFDTPSPTQSSAGDHFSARSIGHLGFTGTSFWLDLEQDSLVILLTNRVYPSRNNDRIRAFRPLVHNQVMEALL